MPREIFRQGKYGVASTFYFSVDVPSGTNSDRFLNAAVPWVAGDVIVYQDGVALGNITALPTRIGSTPLYSMALTAGEMTATDIAVLLVDADGPAWRDTMIRVETKMRLGQIDVDATQIGGNTDAMKLTGVGTGYGLNAVGGATSSGDIFGTLVRHVLRKNTAAAVAAGTITLDASASSADDFYNGSIISIVSATTGAGQSRVITDYVGSTQVATLNRNWVTTPTGTIVFSITPGPDVWNLSPAAELGSLPGATGSYADKIQFLFQRFAFRRTESATTQSLYKSNSTTVLASASVADNGSTQDIGRLS